MKYVRHAATILVLAASTCPTSACAGDAAPHLDNAPIVRIVPGTSALLARGAHVVIFPGAGNEPAPFVIVGEKGVTSPM